ncbi:MAG: DUF547 domain-containing protein [Cytophagales bacterium]
MLKSKIIILLAFLVSIGEISAQSFDSLTAKTDVFFKNYVNSGLVDYSLVKSNIKELNELINLYQQTKLDDTNQKKAMLINFYNLSVIKLLADNYPVSSPQEIQGFFDKKIVSYNGIKLSVNDIENNIIRKEYNDPRVHFVLVCGAVGCPPITNFAYEASLLDKLMNEQTKLALNNDEFIMVKEKAVLLSEIFKWYKEDFLKENKSVVQFINKYRNTPLDENSSIDYYPYNWKINEIKLTFNKKDTVPFDPSEQVVKKRSSTQEFTPSVLYTKGQWEIKHFNNLYSQTEGFDKEGNVVKFNERGNYFSSINQVLFGVNSRFNVGLDFWIKSVRIDNTSSSPFATLSFQDSPKTRTALSSIGPKVKFQPFKKLSHLSIQSTFLIPIAEDQEGASNGKPFLSQDSYISINQIFYDQAIGKKIQLFFSLSPWVYISKKAIANRVSVSTPLDIFVSYFPTDRITLYIQQGFWPNYGENGIASWFRQEGFGAKYQIIKGKLEIESSYTKFTMGRDQGAGATYNLGIRFIHL